MNDVNQPTDPVNATPQEPENAPPETVETPQGIPPSEIEAGKTFAILSYALSFVGLPFFLIPLITRDNDFSLYHAKQSLIIWLAGIVLSIISVPLAVICIGIVLAIVGGIALLVFNIIGLINAVKGEARPVPLIGVWGVDWFKGLAKAGQA